MVEGFLNDLVRNWKNVKNNIKYISLDGEEELNVKYRWN